MAAVLDGTNYNQSWSLFCSAQGFTAWHNSIPTDIKTAPPADSNRVAVYLDWPAGTVSFYCLPCIVSSRKQIHLHTYQTTFTSQSMLHLDLDVYLSLSLMVHCYHPRLFCLKMKNECSLEDWFPKCVMQDLWGFKTGWGSSEMYLYFLLLHLLLYIFDYRDLLLTLQKIGISIGRFAQQPNSWVCYSICTHLFKSTTTCWTSLRYRWEIHR